WLASGCWSRFAVSRVGLHKAHAYHFEATWADRTMLRRGTHQGTTAREMRVDSPGGKTMVTSFARALCVASRSRFHHLVSFSIAGGFVIMTAYPPVPVHAAPGAEAKPASAATQAYLAQFSASLPFADREDFELATRGFIAAIPGNRIVDAEGHVL